jgi:hypothetical protein
MIIAAMILLFLILIRPRDDDSIVIGPIGDKEYTGSQIMPTPWVKYYGEFIEEGKDFVYSYGENEGPGIGTVNVKLINDREGEAAAAFRIIVE